MDNVDRQVRYFLKVAQLKSLSKAREFGAAEKAIIFTESRKTQSYLLRLLADRDFSVLLNGSNNDEHSTLIYTLWLDRQTGV